MRLYPTAARAIIPFALVACLLACNKKSEESQQTRTSTAARDTARTTVASVTYRAFGNEPFWAVTIDPEGLHFVSPDDTAGIHFPNVEAATSGDTLRWSSRSDAGRIEVYIWPGQCSDGMSDISWSSASSVRLNEINFVGCAEKRLDQK